MQRDKKVVIHTDTVFDEEGVPVSVPRGAHGKLVEKGDDMTQVLVHWNRGGTQILGVPNDFVEIL